MNSREFVVLAYAIGLGLIWGYAVTLWIAQYRAARVGAGAICPGNQGGETPPLQKSGR